MSESDSEGDAVNADRRLVGFVTVMDQIEANSELVDQPGPIDRSAVSFAITLCVRGMLVTGEVIGIGEYQRRQGEQWRGALEALSPGSGAETAKAYHLARDEDRAAIRDLGDEYEPAYIHLLNARDVTSSGAVPPFNVDGLLMRIPLSSVDGWALGTLAPPRSQA